MKEGSSIPSACVLEALWAVSALPDWTLYHVLVLMECCYPAGHSRVFFSAKYEGVLLKDVCKFIYTWFFRFRTVFLDMCPRNGA